MNSTTDITVTSPSAAITSTPASNDEHVVELWLHGRSVHTQRAYQRDSSLFRAFASKPLHAVTLSDVQAFASKLEDSCLRPISRNRALSAIKSLLAFAHQIGYLPFDVARPLRLSSCRDTLNERILDEVSVHRLIAHEPKPRNRVLIQLLYAAGLRVSELVGLRWRDVQSRAEGGQITVYGKGGKTRSILLLATTWLDMLSIRGSASEDGPVFPSRRGSSLHPSAVLRVVKAAAKRAGIDLPISPHWLRHAHASHALDHGAPIHLVQATLGHSSVATTSRYLHSRPTDSSSRYLSL